MGRYKAQEVIDAINEADGILAESARILGCTRQTVHNYVNRYATVKDAYHSAREANIDQAERKLMDAVDGGSVTAIKFLLATVGKHRGYVKRQEVTGADGDSLDIHVTLND